MCALSIDVNGACMSIKTDYVRHFLRHKAKRKQRINLYPLLGIVLVILAAVLGYGAMYLLLSS